MDSNGVIIIRYLPNNEAMFNWDPEQSSKKLIIEDDFLTVRVKDGSGFKTSIGDQVSKVAPLLHLLGFQAGWQILLPD